MIPRLWHVRTPEWTGCIPEAWAVGYAQSHPAATVGEAVCTWLDQRRMEQEYELQRKEDAMRPQ